MELNDLQLDTLREIGSIGAGNAATGLSKMLNKKIKINVPSAKVMRLQDVPQFLGGPESLVAVVYFQIKGDFVGSILLVFPLKEALKLTDLLLERKKGKTKEFDELSSSALKELGNISTGSYLTALAQVLKRKIVHSIPYFATDMLQAILDGILIELAIKVEYVVVIDAKFEIEKEAVCGHFIFLPEPEGLKQIFKALKL
jgi:chemotaxis protein CheC